MTTLKVLIAGGGLGGLALAQGLLAQGHQVQVFERDADMNRRQGYYLTMNGDGGEALRQVLPADLFELYLDTARVPYPTQSSIVLDTKLVQLGARPSMGPPNEGERRHTGVDRRTLRKILAARIQDHIHWGVSALGYEEDANGVRLELSDGSTVEGDLLVIADGIRSALRDQRLPDTKVISTAIKGIDLYARTPYTPELLDQIPDQLHDSMNIVADGKGNRALLGSFRPRHPVAEAGAALPEVDLDEVQPYMMVSCSVPPTTVIPPTTEWTDGTRADIKAGMQQTVADWDPAVQAIVAGIDPWSIFSIAFSYLEPEAEWEPSRVTVIGDAAHGMLPTVGMGANSALRDAAVLSAAIAGVGETTSIEDAVGAYEKSMREFAYPIIRIAADHDNVFGGGALSRKEASDHN
jgi:2-polyprenyl-6-methoxyphenol hydroxylase-like FAD-dependent oxidoreductase